MWSKSVIFVASLWLLTVWDFQLQSASAAQDATHEDIRTAIYSFAHTLRDNVDKLERHERRMKQSGDQMQNMLSTIVNKQREQFVDDKQLETSIKSLEQRMNILANAELEKIVDRADTKLMLDNIDKHLVAGEAELKTMLKEEHESFNQLRSSLDKSFIVVSEQIKMLESRFDSLEQEQPKSRVTNDAIFELLKKALEQDLQQTGRSGAVPEPSNSTAELVQETKHAVMEAVRSLADRLDEMERKRESSETKMAVVAESTKAFQDDMQNSFRLMSEEVKALSHMEKVLEQTADNVLDTKRRVEYGTHQILMEVTEAVNDRARELNGSIGAGLERAAKAVLDGQSVATGNLSVKVETEISQVWRQIGTMYQTLTESASTLAALQKQTDAFVNGTVTAVDGMDNKVSAIAGRMTEVDDNLNYLLGRLSLVTQEFKEIKIGLGEALESIRVGLKTVQDTKVTADLGPGPNPIDDEPLSDNINPNALSKTVYSVA